MKWLRWKRALLALLCYGFLCDLGCPTDTTLQTALSNAGQTFGNTIVGTVVKTYFNEAFGTKI
jgi:hypothetical protein